MIVKKKKYYSILIFVCEFLFLCKFLDIYIKVKGENVN